MRADEERRGRGCVAQTCFQYVIDWDVKKIGNVNNVGI